MFVRIKKIAGHEYGYLVENTWTEKGSRQQTKAYLGRIIPLAVEKEMHHDIAQGDFADAILELAKNTLLSCGFNNKYRKGTWHFNPTTLETFNKNKPAVFKIKDGFFCKPTLERLLQFDGKGKEEEVGLRLAKEVVAAGLLVDNTTFVQLFKKVFRRKD